MQEKRHRERERERERESSSDQQQMWLQWIRVWSSPTKLFFLVSFVGLLQHRFLIEVEMEEKKMCERKEREYAQYAAPETDLLAIFHNPFCITQNFFVSNMYNLTQQQWQEISIR
jgi:hypothetical protein